jgi:hypothetical protein
MALFTVRTIGTRTTILAGATIFAKETIVPII